MRRQHLIVQCHPNLFLDHKGRPIRCREVPTLEYVQASRWEHVIVIGIVDEMTNIKAARLSRESALGSVSSATLDMWQNDESLLGVPDELIVHPGFLESSKPAIGWLSSVPVQVSPPGRSSRRYEANRRALLDRCYELTHAWSSDPNPSTFDELQALLAEKRGWLYPVLSQESPKKRAAFEAYFAHQRIDPPHKTPLEQDWALSKSSFLSFGSAIPIAPSETAKLYPKERVVILDPDHIPDTEIARDVLPAYPDSIGRIASSLGITDRAIRAWLRGRPTLNLHQEKQLHEYLGFSRDWSGEFWYWRADSSFVLTPKTALAARRAYGHTSSGGDVEFACTVIPRTGPISGEQLIVWRSHYGYTSAIFWQGTVPLTSEHVFSLRDDEPPKVVSNRTYDRWISLVRDAIADPLQRDAILERFDDDNALLDTWVRSPF